MIEHTREHTTGAKEDIEAGTNTVMETDSSIPNEEIEEHKMTHYLQAWSSNTLDKLVVLNNKFQVQATNPAAAAQFKGSLDKVIGRSCMEVLQCRNLNQTELCGTSSCPLMQVLRQRKSFIQEDLIIGPTPQFSSEMSVSITPTYTDGEHNVIFSMHDLSSIKIANFVRSNFISMVSHELRTPLNSVHGFIDLLLNGHMGRLNQEQQTYLGYTQEGVQQLISAVEDILFMTRSDLGQFEIRPQKMHFHDLASNVVISMQPQAFKAEIRLVLDIPTDTPNLYIDPQRIKQVLINLVSNAIKFTPPSGTVTIRSQHYDERFEMISVTDTGFGIPSADRKHIFERFYQSNHVLQSKMGGYGLGLPIAKLIIEQHGGQLRLGPTSTEGTTFYFTVPRCTERSSTSLDPGIISDGETIFQPCR